MPLTYIKTIIALIKVSKNSMNRKKNILWNILLKYTQYDKTILFLNGLCIKKNRLYFIIDQMLIHFLIPNNNNIKKFYKSLYD